MMNVSIQLISRTKRRLMRGRSGATRARTQGGVAVTWLFWARRGLLLSLTSALILLAVVGFREVRSIPVGEVILTGYTGNVSSSHAVSVAVGATKDELHLLIGDQLNEGFWQLSLQQLKLSLETHPWVRQAIIRRQWPNKLLVGIDEHVAVARWNDQYLLSATGDIFLPSQMSPFMNLPLLKVEPAGSPSREKIKETVAWFNRFQQSLTDYGLSVDGLQQLRDDDFSLLLSNGLTLVLGAGQVNHRFDRFLSLLDGSLVHNLSSIDVIDLRYVNGLSVRWRDSIELAKVETVSSSLK